MIGEYAHGHRDSFFKQPWFIVSLVLLGLLAVGFSAYKFLPFSPAEQVIPQSIRKQASFTLYFPSKLPQGYVANDAAKLVDGTLFYELRNGNNTITISQQDIPDTPPQLDTINGFRKITVPVGEAVIGKNNNLNTVLVLTDSTLLTLRATSSEVQDETIAAVARSMQSL